MDCSKSEAGAEAYDQNIMETILQKIERELLLQLMMNNKH